MRRATRILTGLALVAATFVLLPAAPAAATVTVTSASGVVTVAATGNDRIDFSCSGGSFRAFGLAATPNIACSAVTGVHVTGDGGGQVVVGPDLASATTFPGKPKLQTNLGAGEDAVYETPWADDIHTGADVDTVTLYPGGAANVAVDLGTDDDIVELLGSAGNDTISASATGGNVSISDTTSAGLSVMSADNVSTIHIQGGTGTNKISVAGITAASTVYPWLFGGTGNDTLTTGPHAATFYPKTGNNVINGGPGADLITTDSDTDVIHTGGGGDVIYDMTSGRSGGRVIDGAPSATYAGYYPSTDATVHVRPGASSGAVVTSGLARPGQQVLPASVGVVTVSDDEFPTLATRGVIDVVVGQAEVRAHGDAGLDDLLDVTVPTGTWTTSGSPVVTIATSASSLGNVRYDGTGPVKIHGTWTNKDQGFAHRVTRDLMFRFPTDAARDAIRNQLANHTTTRAQVVASLMNTDEYRGLDVDRVFTQFLKRKSDPSGRTYWINAIRNGRSLRKFRAQLFGSSEYFSKAGGTNAKFVTAAYADSLGRLPDPSGQAYWTNKIDHGMDRGSVANAFLVSSEARRTLVRNAFLRFVLRQPTQAELDQWMPPLQSSDTGEQQLVAFLVGSGAYYAES